MNDQQIADAKKVLNEAGYIVTEKPAEWKEFRAFITMKVQGRNISEKEFVNAVQNAISANFGTRAWLQRYTTGDVVRVSIPEFKQGSRVLATKRSKKD